MNSNTQNITIDSHNLNKKANKLLKELLELIKDRKTQENIDKIDMVISKLEKCSKSLQSQFLDDLINVFKFLLYNKGE